MSGQGIEAVRDGVLQTRTARGVTITEHHLSVFAGPVRRVAQVLQMPRKIEQAPPDPGNPTTETAKLPLDAVSA